MTGYYIWLDNVLQTIAAPLHNLSYQAEAIPPLAALVLGLIGVLSPCQISTNVAALAYASRDMTEPEGMLRSVLSYTLGKILVYSIVGVTVIGLGLQLEQASIPVIVAVRKALGPLLMLVGLVMLGLLRFRFSPGQRIGGWIQGRIPKEGNIGAFLMGVALSFAACPTMFLLFFGVLVPLSLTAGGGLAFPAIFAVGTTFPLLVIAVLVELGVAGAVSHFRDLSRLNQIVSQAAGVLFILIGVNEVLLYWTL